MTPHKILCMFHQGRHHTVWVQYGPKFFTDILSITIYFYTKYTFYYFYKHSNLLYMTKNHSRDMPGTTVTKEKGHTGKLKYQFKFSSFSRGLPGKITYNIVLGLDYFNEHHQNINLLELQKKSYLRCYISTFIKNALHSQLCLVRASKSKLNFLPI